MNRWFFASGIVALLAAAPGAAPQPLPFSDGRWALSGAAKVGRVDGREALSVETGSASRSDVALQDGSIDFDVQVTRRRSFVYVAFRMGSDEECEEFYLRPHKSGLPDAVQYAPVWQGRGSWQLYHGRGATAAPAFEPGAWTHVRVVLQGHRAAFFIGDMRRPVLVVPQLAREPRPGHVAVKAFLPPDTPGEGPIARFADVTVRPGVVPFDFSSLPSGPPAAEPRAVRAWAVSRAFAAPEPGTEAGAALPALPASDVLGEFRPVEAEPGGLLELVRHLPLPPKTRRVAGVARVHVRARQAGLRRLDLGYSDEAVVFLNGRPLFRGDASYSFDAPRQEGLIHYGQAAVFLPLEAEDNELAVLVSDGFGGWGLMARFADTAGLEIEAR